MNLAWRAQVTSTEVVASQVATSLQDWSIRPLLTRSASWPGARSDIGSSSDTDDALGIDRALTTCVDHSEKQSKSNRTVTRHLSDVDNETVSGKPERHKKVKFHLADGFEFPPTTCCIATASSSCFWTTPCAWQGRFGVLVLRPDCHAQAARGRLFDQVSPRIRFARPRTATHLFPRAPIAFAEGLETGFRQVTANWEPTHEDCVSLGLWRLFRSFGDREGGRPSALTWSSVWSGRRDSNPRPSPWQGDALPLSHVRVQEIVALGRGHGPAPPARASHRPADLQGRFRRSWVAALTSSPTASAMWPVMRSTSGTSSRHPSTPKYIVRW